MEEMIGVYAITKKGREELRSLKKKQSMIHNKCLAEFNRSGIHNFDDWNEFNVSSDGVKEYILSYISYEPRSIDELHEMRSSMSFDALEHDMRELLKSGHVVEIESNAYVQQ